MRDSAGWLPDTRALHRHLREALDLPKYYGNNLMPSTTAWEMRDVEVLGYSQPCSTTWVRMGSGSSTCSAIRPGSGLISASGRRNSPMPS